MDIDLNQFIAWQQAKPRRRIEIAFGTVDDDNGVSVWAFDYNLKEGQYVTSVEEIDLEKAYRENLSRKVEEARKAGLVV